MEDRREIRDDSDFLGIDGIEKRRNEILDVELLSVDKNFGTKYINIVAIVSKLRTILRSLDNI